MVCFWYIIVNTLRKDYNKDNGNTTTTTTTTTTNNNNNNNNAEFSSKAH